MGRKHGGKGTRLYRIWKAMRERCNNCNSKAYLNYGGRGIKISKEWNDFAKFRDWAIANGYSDELSIDRVDNNRGYSPDNCRWTTRKEQNNNQRKNIHVTINGKQISLTDLAEQTGIPYTTLYSRYRNGSLNGDISAPKHHSASKHMVEFEGECLCVSEIARRTGLSRSAVRTRYRGGDSSEV